MAWGLKLFIEASRIGAPVPLAVRQQREQSMPKVAGVLDNYYVLPLTTPGIEVLDDSSQPVPLLTPT